MVPASRTWEIPAIENRDNLCGFQLQELLRYWENISCTCAFRLIGVFFISDSRRYFTLGALERTWGSQRHQASSVYQIQETVSWKLSMYPTWMPSRMVGTLLSKRGLKHWKIEHECTMSFFFGAAEYLLLASPPLFRAGCSEPSDSKFITAAACGWRPLWRRRLSSFGGERGRDLVGKATEGAHYLLSPSGC